MAIGPDITTISPLGTISFMDPGGGLTDDFAMYPLILNTGGQELNISTTTKYPSTQLCSYNLSATGGGGSPSLEVANTVSDAGGRFSVYFNVSNLPIGLTGGTASIFLRLRDGTDTSIVAVAMNTNGQICINSAGTTTVLATGSSSLEVVPNTWYRLCFIYTITSTTVNQFVVYINGQQTINASNLTIPGTGSNRIALALSATFNTTGGGTTNIYYNNVFVDNYVTGFVDCGPILVSAKLSSTVQSNQWPTIVGNGTTNNRPILPPYSASNNFFAGIDVAPPNGVQTANNSGLIQTYSIQDRTTGDENLTTANVLGYMGWVMATQSTTGDGSTVTLYVNGSTYTIVPTASPIIYFKCIASTTYPSANNTVGLSVTGGNKNNVTNLYDCGMAIAYYRDQVYKHSQGMTSQT